MTVSAFLNIVETMAPTDHSKNHSYAVERRNPRSLIVIDDMLRNSLEKSKNTVDKNRENRSLEEHLAVVPKAELIATIEKLHLPVHWSKHDSTRAIAARLLQYLAEHPEAVEQIENAGLAYALKLLRNL